MYCLFIYFRSFYSFFTFAGGFSQMVKYTEETFFSGRSPCLLLCISAGSALRCLSVSVFLTGSFTDPVKINSRNPARFIFGVISHVASALCDQTGFRNIFGRTWLSIHKKLYPALLIELQFFSERLHGFPAALCM